MSKSGTTVEFQYDHNGLRVGKVVTVNNVATTTEYTLHGKLVTGLKQGSNKLHFFYDAQNRPAMVKFNGNIYTYVHNLQGDIIAILDSNGSAVVEYKYDAWGRQYSVSGSMMNSLGKLNPFRYRCYVYDEETSLYYLRARYYNPEWGRFINADIFVATGNSVLSSNVYVYCSNAPTMYSDRSGYIAKKLDDFSGPFMATYIIEGDAFNDILRELKDKYPIEAPTPEILKGMAALADIYFVNVIDHVVEGVATAAELFGLKDAFYSATGMNYKNDIYNGEEYIWNNLKEQLALVSRDTGAVTINLHYGSDSYGIQVSFFNNAGEWTELDPIVYSIGFDAIFTYAELFESRSIFTLYSEVK